MKLSRFGQVIENKDQTPKALVMFYPPATGDKGQQKEEAYQLQSFGYLSLLYNPPYRNFSNTGGITNIQGEVQLWERARKEFPSVVETARKQFGEKLKIAVIGKNLGGLVAAYSTNELVSCLIVTGSVPTLSRFWISSVHPVAIEYRKNFSQNQLDEFQKATSKFDLIQTIPNLKQRNILVQFGIKDSWIEKESADNFASKLHERDIVQWVEDDHAMASELASKGRKHFLRLCE